MNSNLHPAHRPSSAEPLHPPQFPSLHHSITPPLRSPDPAHPPLPNPRHEAFAQAVASGLNATDAWLTVHGRGRRDSAGRTGTRLRKNPAVAARIAALQSAAARNVTIDLQKILGFLDRVISTPIAEVSPSSDLCHRKKTTAHGDDLAMPDKLAAAALAARLLGLFRAPPTPPVPVSPHPPNVLLEEERLILIAQKRAAMEAEAMDDDDTESDNFPPET